MQVHLGDSFGYRRVVAERNQVPTFHWCDINVAKFVGLLKDFCEMSEN